MIILPANILYLHETSKLAGAENSLILLAKNIDRKRFSPIFVLPEPGPLVEAIKNIGIEVHLIPMPKIRRLRGVVGSLSKLNGFVREKNIALIHSNSIRTHIYGTIASKMAGIPVVWHERNLLIKEKLDPERILSFVPDAIICNSNAVARRFERRGKLPSKVSVIHNGADLAAFSPSVNGKTVRDRFFIKSGDTVVGIVARFDPNKGHETFFRAAGILIKEMRSIGSPIRFLVVGGAVFEEDAWYETRLRGLIQNMGIKDHVIFTGVCSDMPSVYAAMDIVVSASEVEACSRVISEAMAMGKPVVATNTGGTPEMVVDGFTGILVPPLDPAKMADAMKQLIRDKEKMAHMGYEGRNKAQVLFDIKRSAVKVEDLYGKILGK